MVGGGGGGGGREDDGEELLHRLEARMKEVDLECHLHSEAANKIQTLLEVRRELKEIPKMKIPTANDRHL